MKKKVLFEINVNHSIDIITNSSSELFVLEGKSKEIVAELVSSLYSEHIAQQSEEWKEKYPTYRDEYEEIKHISELSADELDNYFSYSTGSYIWPAKKSDYIIPKGFTFDEVYEPDGEKPAWNGEIQYKVKNNNKNMKTDWDRSFVTEENKEWFLNIIDPNRTKYFMYSSDENPNWDFQEKMMGIGARYHLG